MARTEVRKECPSCGLGVPLDAKVCEFCGWDFEEEDEWISQIEQLERELMSEKQKTETTKVDRMIRSTLRSPVREKPPAPSKPIAVTIKKRIQSKPSAEELPAPEALEVPEKPEEITVSVPPLTAPEKMTIPVEGGAEEKELPPPPEELEKKKAAVPASKPGIALPPGKKVRRVVKGARPSTAAPGKVVTPSVQPAPKMTPPSKPSAAPQKPSAPPAPAPAAKPKPVAPIRPVEPEKEKKGLFSGLGKIFSFAGKPAAAAGKPSAPTEPIKKPVVGAAKGAPAPQQPKKAPPAREKEEKPAVVTVKVFVCPLCNAEVKETEKICPKCGAEFE